MQVDEESPSGKDKDTNASEEDGKDEMPENKKEETAANGGEAGETEEAEKPPVGMEISLG